MAGLFVEGICKNVLDVVPTVAENAARQAKGWKIIPAHRVATVLAEEGDKVTIRRVEMMNGKIVKPGEKVRLAVMAYARGNRVALVCYE